MKLTIREMTLIAIYPAMMAATAGFNIPMGQLPPVSLQTFFVFLAGLTLGWKLGSISMIIYVLLGVIGLPVFAGYKSIEAFLTGSGGFIVSFIIAAFVIGFVKNVKIINNKKVNVFIILFLVNILIYIIGSTYVAYLYDLNYWVVLAGMYIYLGGDIIKIIAATYVYPRIRNHITYERA